MEVIVLVELNNDNFENETSKGLKLIEFYTTWCTYCRNQRIELEGFKESDMWIGLVDGDEYPNLVQKFGINGFPTFILLKDGEKEVVKYSSLLRKSFSPSTMCLYLLLK
jgi:thioredoxin 1